MRVQSVDWKSRPYPHQRLPLQLAPGWLGAILVLALSCSTLAGECGGTIPCQCGDTVTADHTMTYDLGPCPRLGGADVDTVGLVVQSGVTLDCQDHRVIGPGDTLKNAFGIRVGFRTASVPVTDVTIRNCLVTRFWWGVYVQNAHDIVVEHNTLQENGWKDPRHNGTGYGLSVANAAFVTVRDNMIVDSGNEGFHLSHSTDVTVENNLIADSGFEQLYLFFADNTNNTFFYEHFQGLVLISGRSANNRFDLSAFENPTNQCMRANALGTYVYKGYFNSCKFDFRTNNPATLDHCTGVEKKAGRITLIFPGCTADLDRDGNVDDLDRSTVLAALGSTLSAPHWNPEGDLDHDGDVDSDDVAVLDTQFGPCGP